MLNRVPLVCKQAQRHNNYGSEGGKMEKENKTEK